MRTSFWSHILPGAMRLPCLLGGALGLVLASSGAAQCSTQWLPGEGLRGTNDAVYCATMWDPDGPGPLSQMLVVGGSFTSAGNVSANRIALHDPSSGLWSALGTGIEGAGAMVYALATLPSGELVAGGMFTSAGGVPASAIARWNGTGWSAMGAGMGRGIFTPSVSALTTLPNGDLVAGGLFTTAGGVSASSIARWNGLNWSPLGTGLSGACLALTTMPNGDIVAGGGFTTAGGVSASRIARWNGSTWSPLGTGMNNNTNVRALAALPNGDIVAGGTFATAGAVPASRIARWNGTSWFALGAGLGGACYSLTALSSGDIVAGGVFTTAGGFPCNRVARWDGTSWSGFGMGVSGPSIPTDVSCVTPLPNGDLVAGGNFTAAGSEPVGRIARWDGTNWSALSPGMTGAVKALATLNGDLVAGGSFTAAGIVSANYVARWNGVSWAALGTGMNAAVNALAVMPNGDLVAGGEFTTAGGAPANFIARWDGQNWSALGAGTSAAVNALATLPNGDLAVGGSFALAGGVSANGIAQWNGTHWSTMGTGLGNSPWSATVSALTTLANGDLVVGGNFNSAGGTSAYGIARWDGTSWAAMGMIGSSVYSLARLPQGDIVAGGGYFTAGSPFVARWNGASWVAMGTGMNNIVYALTTLPNGDIVAGGEFTMAGGVPANRIARWNGTSWAALDAGMDGNVLALTSLPSGDLVAGGAFATAGPSVSTYLARLTTTCPATATPIPTACIGPSGPISLTASTLPWTGGTFRSTATGLGANAVAASLVGFGSPATPLSLLSPIGIPGCDLLASPDSALILVPTAGSASWQFNIPNSSAWAGVPLFHQFLQLELAPTMTLSSSNALALTLGTF